MAGVLLFGGSFDPLHHGHLVVSRAAAETLQLDRVVLIPSAHPPHKTDQRLAPAAARLHMCNAATANDPWFEVSDWELTQPPPSYTLKTVAHFAARLPGAALYWLIGSDTLRELHLWYEIGQLAEQCTFVTAARPGFDPGPLSELSTSLSKSALARIRAHILITTPRIEISATEIRARRSAGRSIRYLVPPVVADYIAAERLYGP